MELIGEEELFRANCLCEAYGDTMVKIGGELSSINCTVFEEFIKLLEFKKNFIKMKLINDTFEEDILRILRDNNNASFIIMSKEIQFVNDSKVLYEVQSLMFSSKKFSNTVVHDTIWNEGMIQHDSSICKWTINEFGYSIVHVAVMKNDVSLLEKLLEYHPSIDILHGVTTDKKSILDLAAECANNDAINLLVNHESFNAEYFLNEENTKFLETIISHNNMELLRRLLHDLSSKCGASELEEKISWKLLAKAVRENNIDMSKYLLSLWPASRRNTFSRCEPTILHVAAANKVNPPMMKLLLEGTTLELREKIARDGYSALHRGIIAGDKENIRILQTNVSESFCDRSYSMKPLYRTSIQLACSYGADEFVKDILANRSIEYREQEFIAFFRKTTLLQCAVSEGHLNVVRTLLNGARPTIIKPYEGMFLPSYLHCAVSNRYAQVVRELLEFEPDLSKYEKNDSTPMECLFADNCYYRFKPQVPLSTKQEVFEALIENIGWYRHLNQGFTSNKEQMNNFYALLLTTWAEQWSRVLWLLDGLYENGFQVFWSNDTIVKDSMIWIDDIAWR
eukprot:TRINITY_DN8341_c0_g1_i4.p1 TRINITY_DN8341_c0_g1~~TRINITY_DN8341_c0_g1_i4.p1  ORF type:complete len:567 (-),score=84.69 TRINITY_DN8341_c0_g1_i4:179-1879(-)